jgi:hypothetical protein
MPTHNHSLNRLDSRTARTWWLVALLFALVCVQGLGFVHRIVHAPGAAWTSVQPDARSVGNAGRGSWVVALFSAHDDESGCRLYDGVGQQVFALPAAVVVCAILPASERLRLLAGEFVARRAALFEARGPPLSR